jgi:hypothetical protein
MKLLMYSKFNWPGFVKLRTISPGLWAILAGRRLLLSKILHLFPAFHPAFHAGQAAMNGAFGNGRPAGRPYI